MRKVKLGGHVVEIFDSIDELPILRFHKYNKMLIVDMGVGADLNNVDNHVERAIRYVGSNPAHAIEELNNLRQCLYLIQQEVSPKHLAFCVLIKSIDGKPQNDLSDDGLKALLEKLKDATAMETDQLLESVKKKIDEELQTYYPGLFDDASIKEYYDELKRRTMLILDEIISGNKKTEEIDSITTMLITYTKPQIFYGKESVEVEYDKQFENMCLILSQKLNVQPKGFTVLEYYNAFMFLKKQGKPNGKKEGAK